MRAVQFTALNHLSLATLPSPVPAPGEVRVRLRAAALNHRDLWIKLGQYAGITYPCTPGSDGAGIVEAVGPDVDRGWLGREVIINPSLDWGDREEAQGPTFSILGLPRPGTLAEEITVPVAQLSPRPAHLSWVEAAALPLAGLTAYRALFSRARLERSDRVLITGIGGGVALAALQFAVSLGAEVWVTSGSADKLARAFALGARNGFDYRDPAWPQSAVRAAGGPFSVIVDSAGGAGFESLVDVPAPGARIVLFGATAGNPPTLPSRNVFWRHLTLLGSTMGSPNDWAAMLRFVTEERITPIVSEVFPLAEAGAAFDHLAAAGQFGKIVLKME